MDWEAANEEGGGEILLELNWIGTAQNRDSSKAHELNDWDCIAFSCSLEIISLTGLVKVSALALNCNFCHVAKIIFGQESFTATTTAAPPHAEQANTTDSIRSVGTNRNRIR